MLHPFPFNYWQVIGKILYCEKGKEWRISKLDDETLLIESKVSIMWVRKRCVSIEEFNEIVAPHIIDEGGYLMYYGEESL